MVVAFPAGAVTSFAKGTVESTGALAPFAVVEQTLGVMFGTWTREEQPEDRYTTSTQSEPEPEQGGDAHERHNMSKQSGCGWRATVGFMQPWEGNPRELVAWQGLPGIAHHVTRIPFNSSNKGSKHVG